jgi:hypothetical protein
MQMIHGHSFFFCYTFSEGNFHAALGKLDENHFQLGRRAWSVILWRSFVDTIGWICLVGAIGLRRVRSPRGVMRCGNRPVGGLGRFDRLILTCRTALGGYGLSRH